jgi:hypothetical protein
VSAHYGYTSADHTYAGTVERPNALNEKLALQMGILTGGVEAPTGTGLGITLPFASLWRTNGDIQASDPKHPSKTDNGLGDFEVRLRQDVLAPLRLDLRFHLALSAGFVAPTGKYITDPIYITSIGRGVWWGLGEGDVSFDITQQWAALVGGGLRIPSGSAPDGITWGKEAEGSAGIRFSQKISAVGISLKRISVSLSGQYLWRDGATRKTTTDIEPVDDIGGSFVNLSPSVTANLSEVLFLTVSGRVPLWRDVKSSLLLNQLVPNAGVYVSFGGTFGGHSAPAAVSDPSRAPRLGEPAQLPEVASLLVKDRWTVIAYEASWCEGCERLGRDLAIWERQHQGLAELKRLDATHWDRDGWSKFLPDASELPVVDVFGPDGRLKARLLGEQAFTFSDHLPKDQPAIVVR